MKFTALKLICGATIACSTPRGMADSGSSSTSGGELWEETNQLDLHPHEVSQPDRLSSVAQSEHWVGFFESTEDGIFYRSGAYRGQSIRWSTYPVANDGDVPEALLGKDVSFVAEVQGEEIIVSQIKELPVDVYRLPIFWCSTVIPIERDGRFYSYFLSADETSLEPTTGESQGSLTLFEFEHSEDAVGDERFLKERLKELHADSFSVRGISDRMATSFIFAQSDFTLMRVNGVWGFQWTAKGLVLNTDRLVPGASLNASMFCAHVGGR